MKPRDGMIQQAMEKYPTIDLANSFMIGDSAVDVELAIGLGIKGFGIKVGSEYKAEHIVQLTDIRELVQQVTLNS
ncbi:HAD hydrolase-like protein [Gracilibacillus sp. S3-1-1]|uniref:HAD hydrolase-like protein n=1 Tax=Gracilibacillus pellucidus TaxID=3095368 RepID=A0ACC6M8J2_9BACI|nr:HAD hydrolase-like protein [Gracilibacillus sp. S3-1-1]MDX8047162.1 HAD hydrolase-like protein [Gracilibacillus sp. S3-1-1]